MNQLGGEVFIKTNWSSPKDAAWIATNKSLKCSRLEDVYLLLKSSDIVANDFSHKFKEPEVDPDKTGYCVVLREWREINPSMEYRCYVMTNQIVAISQRNCNSYYDHIQASRHEILKDLVNFYRRRLHKKFSLETCTKKSGYENCPLKCRDSSRNIDGSLHFAQKMATELLSLKSSHCPPVEG